MRLFGLIGFPLGHSFSKKYFADKFAKENITNASYRLFEMPRIEAVNLVFDMPGLKGFNVTIPYKAAIMPYLNALDQSAEKVGAVNVVKVEEDGTRRGFNSDYYGFRASLEKWLPHQTTGALVLGTGGAAQAVKAVLRDMQIPLSTVSRDSAKADFCYDDLSHHPDILNQHKLIVNTTPLGTYPIVEAAPELPYHRMDHNFFLYDLVYNPSETLFMKKGKAVGAHVKNGLEMLELQAEKSWEIWNS
jgi:shikimate dehydrogenase